VVGEGGVVGEGVETIDAELHAHASEVLTVSAHLPYALWIRVKSATNAKAGGKPRGRELLRQR